jgi:phosphoribosylformylglycinamidine synthase
VRACHDCSDGGIAVALAESCLGGRVGLKAELGGLPVRWPLAAVASAAVAPDAKASLDGIASLAAGVEAAGPATGEAGALLPGGLTAMAARALFSESGGRFVVSIRREDRERFEETLTGLPLRWVGETTEEPSFIVSIAGHRVVDSDLAHIERAFKSPIA